MTETTRELLERAVAADFDDVAAHLAYADYLQEENDPRGDYIHLRLAAERHDLPAREAEKLRNRAFKLLHAHERKWLGPLAEFLLPPPGRLDPEPESPNVEPTYSRGWLTGLVVHALRRPFVDAVASAPQARMLHKLVLRDTQSGGPAFLSPLTSSPHFNTLRHLELGDREGYECTAAGESVTDLVAKNPHIRELRLLALGLDTRRLFALPMPDLETLQVVFADAYPLDVLAANATLGGLRDLALEPRVRGRNMYGLAPFPTDADESDFEMYLGEEEAAGYEAPNTEELRSFFASPHLRLRRLSLRMPGVGDRAAAILAGGSPALEHVEALSLSEADLTDDGARDLARSPHLAGLGRLYVERNRLTEAGIAALEATGVRLFAAYQFFDGDEYGDEDIYFNGEGI